MEEGLKCFDTAKDEAQNASHTAQMAFDISEQAKKVSTLLVLHFFHQTVTIFSLQVPAITVIISRYVERERKALLVQFRFL